MKLFAQQYLTDATQDELRELPEVMDTSDSMNEVLLKAQISFSFQKKTV